MIDITMLLPQAIQDEGFTLHEVPEDRVTTLYHNGAEVTMFGPGVTMPFIVSAAQVALAVAKHTDEAI